MKRLSANIIAYFPVLLVSLQVMANLAFFIDRDFYMAIGFYLNLFIGSNLLFAFFLLVITFRFKFCAISRWAAVAECFFALWYLIFQEDDIYNIVMQISIGSLAVIITLVSIYKQYPLCRFSLFLEFWKSFWARKGDCDKALDRWDKVVLEELGKKNNVGDA